MVVVLSPDVVVVVIRKEHGSRIGRRRAELSRVSGTAPTPQKEAGLFALDNHSATEGKGQVWAEDLEVSVGDWKNRLLGSTLGTEI